MDTVFPNLTTSGTHVAPLPGPQQTLLTSRAVQVSQGPNTEFKTVPAVSTHLAVMHDPAFWPQGLRCKWGGRSSVVKCRV